MRPAACGGKLLFASVLPIIPPNSGVFWPHADHPVPLGKLRLIGAKHSREGPDMIEMSPFYAHSSSVGPVFDVATWSDGKARKMGIFGLLVGLGFVLVTLFLANPLWFMELPKAEPMKGLVGGILDAHTDSPWGVRAGMAVTGLFGWMSAFFGIASLRDAGGNYYFRVGPGGISVRVPDGVDWTMCCLKSAVFQLDAPWNEIEKLTVVQQKQFGSLSRNAGNIGASIKLRLQDGRKHEFSVDMFREAGYIIHRRIGEATEMVPADLGGTAEDGATEYPVTA